MKFSSLLFTAVCLSVLPASGLLLAQPNTARPSAQDQTASADGQQTEPDAADVTSPPANPPTQFNKVTSLIGMEVRNHHNEKIGSIKDIVIDFQAERVAYAVLATGGVLGFGEKWLPVSVDAFFPDPEGKYLMIRAEKKAIEKVQGFELENWPDLNDPFQEPPFWKKPPKEVNPSPKSQDAPAARDAQPPATQPAQAESSAGSVGESSPKTPPKAAGAGGGTQSRDSLKPSQHASKLVGMQVQNHKQEDIGVIKDVVINLNTAQVSYAVLATGGVLGIGEKLLAVPLRVFKPSSDPMHLILPIEIPTIAKAKGFDSGQWPDLNQPRFGDPPFWELEVPKEKPVPKANPPPQESPAEQRDAPRNNE